MTGVSGDSRKDAPVTDGDPGSCPSQQAAPSHFRGWDLPHPEVIKADPNTCPHAVLDEMSGVPWGFEDCVTCGKRFPMRGDDDA